MSGKGNSGTTLWLKRRVWDAKRFGLTPAGIGHKLGFGREPKIISISLPKAGTHLIERALCLHPDLSRMISPTIRGDKTTQLDHLERLLKRQRPGQIICGHIHHSPEAAGLIADHDAVVVFIVRDPRDMVVSSAHYINSRKHPWHDLALASPALRDRIRLFIDGEGEDRPPAIDRRLRVYAGWLEDATTVIRYEEMVDAAQSRDTVQKMFRSLGVPFTAGQLESISSQLISPVSVTFRSGESGGWQVEMDEELTDRFHVLAGDTMKMYGYS